MKAITILLLLTFSLSSFAGFFDFFKSKPRIKPIDIPTEEERMAYLKQYDPNFYNQIKAAQDGIIDSGNSALEQMQDRHDAEWKRYEAETLKAYDPAEAERKLAEEKQRRDAEHQRQLQQKEREILEQYKLVNGKLVNRADEIKLIKSQQDEVQLREAIKKFQKEEGLQQLRDDQKLNIGN